MRRKKYIAQCFSTDRGVRVESCFESVLYDDNQVELMIDITETKNSQVNKISGLIISLQEMKKLRNVLNNTIEGHYNARIF